MSSKQIKGPWFITSLFLIVMLVISASFALYYYSAYKSLEQSYTRILSELEELTYSTNLLVEFSNGTKIWYNGTLVPIGSSLFNLTTRTVGDLEYQTMYGSVFITSIMGERNSGNFFWLWYLWNSSTNDWVLGMVGSDQYILHDGDTLAWYFADISSYPSISKP
ncbi:MAG: DUF4430 domain-containing protein [Thermoproteota archaeon]